jgi:EH domain-containing protein 1
MRLLNIMKIVERDFSKILDLDREKDLDRDNYIESMRKELLYLIERELTPLALKYQYSDTPLESKVKWKPIVLILGNYSSGKSSLINEFIGNKVQQTGQAPIDDCFTVITCDHDDETISSVPEGTIMEERDGHVLIHDEQYPFEHLKKHGDRFASHFRLKRINAKVLKHIALIDTPGMLDAISEKDRGYDFQAAIGDLALVSDLILVLFDPHKAGAIHESHFGLRQTLPEKTLENRLIFVLNRVDECRSFEDLLKVYGSLCWNLAHMTCRKDIPRILLTYSPTIAKIKTPEPPDFLAHLPHRRDDLEEMIFNAPKHRLDHLVSFTEHHSGRLAHIIEALLAYLKERHKFYLKVSFLGGFFSFVIGMLLSVYFYSSEFFGEISQEVSAALGGVSAVLLYIAWQFFIYRFLMDLKHQHLLRKIDSLTPLTFQSRKDSWVQIKDSLLDYLTYTSKMPTKRELNKELQTVHMVYNRGTKEIRAAVNAHSGPLQERDYY